MTARAILVLVGLALGVQVGIVWFSTQGLRPAPVPQEPTPTPKLPADYRLVPPQTLRLDSPSAPEQSRWPQPVGVGPVLEPWRPSTDPNQVPVTRCVLCK